MSKTAESMINVMRSWIGFNEANGKHKEIINLYNSVKPLPRGYAVKYTDEWCDTAISAAAIKSGCESLIGRECGVEEHVNIFKKKGIWIEDGTITPKTGYIIVYSWKTSKQPNNSYSNHIGLVESVSGNTIKVIEGNYNESVGRRSVPVGWGYIRGYAAPKYEPQSTTSTPATPTPNVTAVAKDVIAGKYGNGTARKKSLEAKGYNYNEVQTEVNRLLNNKTVDLTAVAKDVIAGKYGNGTARKKALQAKGYDYAKVQAKVNEILR